MLFLCVLLWLDIQQFVIDMMNMPTSCISPKGVIGSSANYENRTDMDEIK